VTEAVLAAVAAERLERMRMHLASLADDYAQAVADKDWEVLGYPSIEAWRDAILGEHRFTADARKHIVSALASLGMTVRAIADATGAGTGTVGRDVQAIPGVPDGTPGQQAARERERGKRHNARTDYVPPPARPPAPEVVAAAQEWMREQDRRIDRLMRKTFASSSGAARDDDDDVPLIEPPQDDSKEWPSYEPDDFATADAVTKVIFRAGGWSPRRRRELADALWDWLGADELREVTEVLMTRLEEG
jgi:hypothetical protein